MLTLKRENGSLDKNEKGERVCFKQKRVILRREREMPWIHVRAHSTTCCKNVNISQLLRKNIVPDYTKIPMFLKMSVNFLGWSIKWADISSLLLFLRHLDKTPKFGKEQERERERETATAKTRKVKIWRRDFFSSQKTLSLTFERAKNESPISRKRIKLFFPKKKCRLFFLKKGKKREKTRVSGKSLLIAIIFLSKPLFSVPHW